MKKIYSLFIFSFLLFLGGVSFAQTFTSTMRDTIVYGPPLAGGDIDCHINNYIRNKTANSMDLDMRRVQDVNLATGWQTSFCLDQTCYAPFIDSVRFTLAPNDSAHLIIHFNYRFSTCLGVKYPLI